MPVNLAKVDVHSRRIEVIDDALRSAENFGDRKTWLDLGEGRQLLHVTELNALRDKEEAIIRDAVRGVESK